MPNPDGSMTKEERTKALLAIQKPAVKPEDGNFKYGQPRDSTAFHDSMVDNNIAVGNRLDGAQARNPNLDGQSGMFGNLNQGEEIAKRERAFSLGEGNNAATSAMIGNAMATGDKFSGQFAGDAATAESRANAAANRGTAMFQGDTSTNKYALDAAANANSNQGTAYSQLMQLAQQKQGPSAAEAQLRQATDANTANALAMARSGRGMGGSQSAMRQAIAQNATTQQQANNQGAQLRASEDVAFQGQRLNAYTGAGTVAGQQASAAVARANAGLDTAKYTSDTALRGTQLNDASAQSWLNQKQQAEQLGMGAEVGAQTQALNVNSTAMSGRENEIAAANTKYATDRGIASTQAIADANRQTAYLGAGIGAAGTVGSAAITAISDERAKTNITPLGDATDEDKDKDTATGGMNGIAPATSAPKQMAQVSPSAVVQPLASQEKPQEAARPMTGPSLPQIEKANADERKKATGGAVGGAAGNVAGSVAGGAVGSTFGPVGTVAGKVIGGFLGGAIGSTIGKLFSDERVKKNIAPLDEREGDAYSRLDAFAKQNGAGGVAANHDAVDKYAKEPADKAESANPVKATQEKGFLDWTRQNDLSTPTQKSLLEQPSRPVVTKGDALLADSARHSPGSIYQYKDPADGPGTYVGPMAQDLASHPVTRGAVGQDPATGKLFVDGARLATVNTAQNHSQQNQLDALDAKIAELQGLLGSKKKRDGESSFGARR